MTVGRRLGPDSLSIMMQGARRMGMSRRAGAEILPQQRRLFRGARASPLRIARDLGGTP